MNVHSYGGYFMWPPGAYAMPGRVTLPRPSAEEAAMFQASAKRIVGAIAASRGTVTWPSRTGPVADVLYSAAGNSADQLYYELGIFAWDFEIGNDRWNPTTRRVGGRRLPAAVPRGARRVPGVRGGSGRAAARGPGLRRSFLTVSDCPSGRVGPGASRFPGRGDSQI